MKRLLPFLIALLFPALSFAQNPATVTGHAIFPSNGAASNAQVCFTLTNFKPNLPRIVGTGVLVRQQGWCIVPSTVDGSFSVPLDRNDFVTPSGTYWRVDYLWNNVQQSSANFLINHTPFNLDTELPLSQTPIAGPNQIITQVFTCPNLTPSTTWTCTDNFNDPNVNIQVFNTSGFVIYPDTVSATPNVITLTFVLAQAGTAVIIHGVQNISIATNQPNALLQNPIGAQVVNGSFPLSISAPTAFSGGFFSNAITDSSLAPGGCVGTGTGGLLIVNPGTCATSASSVITTGSPASGNLTKFSGPTSITNGDLSGDCSTSGTLTLLCTKLNGVTIIGTNGNMVKFGAGNSLVDTGFAASSVVLPSFAGTFSGNYTNSGNITDQGNNSHSGTETFTGLLQCKNFENIRCVDTTNSQGWAGSDPGQWINSAMTAAASGGTGGIVWVMPGNYGTTATTIALTGPSTLLLQGADLFSTANPVISTSGNGNSVFGLSRNISTIVNNGTGITITMAANSSFNTFRDFLIVSSSTGDAFQFNDNDRATSVENVQMSMGAHGGHCAQQVAGTFGTEFNRFTQVWCTASASPAFNFDTSGGTNAGNWEYFEDVFAVSVSGSGVGFLVANGSATFVRTSTDTSGVGYQFGASVNGVARISMENTDSEGDTTGISIVGPGDYTIKHHNCGTISGTCIAVASAGANTTIIDPASQATGGANDITYSAASTGRHIVIGGAGLSKAISATAPAFYTAIGADIVANGGRISAGGAPATGSIAGDITCQRGTNSGACYLGGDGNVYLLRSAGNSTLIQVGGAGLGLAEITSPGSLANQDVCYGDSTAHAVKCSYNNGSFNLLPTVTAADTTTTHVLHATATANIFTASAIATGDLPTSGIPNVVYNNAVNTGTAAMTLNMAASTTANSLVAPAQAGLTSGTNGAIAYDTTNNNTHIRTNSADSLAVAEAAALAANNIPKQTDATHSLIAASLCNEGGTEANRFTCTDTVGANFTLISTTVGQQTVTGADYTNSTTTPSTVFSWTLPATTVAKNYRYSCEGLWESTAATLTAPVFGLNISAAPTQLTGNAWVNYSSVVGAQLATTGYLSNATTGSQTLITATAAGTTTVNYMFRIWGTIEAAPTAGSTFIINAAALSSVTSTINIRRGAGCLLTASN